MIGNGLEGKIAQLNLELIDNKKESVMLSIKESISSIENSFAEIKHENISAIKEMSKQLHETLILLDLTKSQQHNLQDIAQSCLKKSNAAFYKSVNISESLGNISEQLFSITGSKV